MEDCFDSRILIVVVSVIGVRVLKSSMYSIGCALVCDGVLLCCFKQREGGGVCGGVLGGGRDYGDY